MRKFSFIEPESEEDTTPVEVFVTEEDIIKGYYPHWKEGMIRIGKEDLVSEKTCIEDWIIVYWAKEITDATRTK